MTENYNPAKFLQQSDWDNADIINVVIYASRVIVGMQSSTIPEVVGHFLDLHEEWDMVIKKIEQTHAGWRDIIKEWIRIAGECKSPEARLVLFECIHVTLNAIRPNTLAKN